MILRNFLAQMLKEHYNTEKVRKGSDILNYKENRSEEDDGKRNGQEEMEQL